MIVIVRTDVFIFQFRVNVRGGVVLMDDTFVHLGYMYVQ